MFERHFGLRENPFSAGHQLRFLYPSREHQEARAHLRYGIENREPFLLITGEVGTGKTTAIYDALSEWGNSVAVALITNSALTRQELLEEIALRFGLPLAPGSSKPQTMVQLERHLLAVRARGEYAVLLMDEAQNLSTELLEEIRLLSNLEAQGEKLVQIFLVGQPELELKLARPELRQLRQRITVHYRLNPLSPEETAGYVHHRVSVAGGNAWVIFPPDTCREIYRLTHGIPREINTVASAALIAAFAENQPAVTIPHVQQVARETEFRSVIGAADEPPPLPPSPIPAQEPVSDSPPSPYAAPSTWTPPAAAAPAPPRPEPPPPVVVPPAAPPAAQWSPRPLEPSASMPTTTPPASPEPRIVAPPAPPAPERIDPVEAHELDAWNAAVRDLFEARRRQDSGAPSLAPPATTPPPAPEPRVSPEPERFPTHEELLARGATADPTRADLTGLPASLREQIEADIAREESGRPLAPWLVAASMLAVFAVGAVLLQRFGVVDVPLLRSVAGDATPAQGPPEMPPSQPPGDSVTTTTPVTVPQASSTAGAGTAAQATPRTGASPRASEASPAAAVPAAPAAARVPAPAPVVRDTVRVYGIAVGSYLDETRAGEERTRLADATQLPGRVMPYLDAGVTMYRLVLGNWPSERAAESGASDLLARGIVPEARVLLLSSRVQR